jgi:hypothetical protein
MPIPHKYNQDGRLKNGGFPQRKEELYTEHQRWVNEMACFQGIRGNQTVKTPRIDLSADGI